MSEMWKRMLRKRRGWRHTRGTFTPKTIKPTKETRTVARGTPGFSGADLANLVNESALLAARKNKRIVTNQEFEEITCTRPQK